MDLEIVLKYFLPKEMLEYFDLVKIERTTEDVLLLHLDKKSIKPTGHTEKQLVYHSNNILNNNLQIDLSSLSKGFYLLNIKNQNKVVTKKIIKQ